MFNCRDALAKSSPFDWSGRRASKFKTVLNAYVTVSKSSLQMSNSSNCSVFMFIISHVRVLLKEIEQSLILKWQIVPNNEAASEVIEIHSVKTFWPSIFQVLKHVRVLDGCKLFSCNADNHVVRSLGTAGFDLVVICVGFWDHFAVVFWALLRWSFFS